MSESGGDDDDSGGIFLALPTLEKPNLQLRMDNERKKHHRFLRPFSRATILSLLCFLWSMEPHEIQRRYHQWMHGRGPFTLGTMSSGIECANVINYCFDNVFGTRVYQQFASYIDEDVRWFLQTVCPDLPRLFGDARLWPTNGILAKFEHYIGRAFVKLLPCEVLWVGFPCVDASGLNTYHATMQNLSRVQSGSLMASAVLNAIICFLARMIVKLVLLENVAGLMRESDGESNCTHVVRRLGIARHCAVSCWISLVTVGCPHSRPHIYLIAVHAA